MSADVAQSPRESPANRPSPGGRLPALDALRAVGAIAVVATHVGFWTATTQSGFWGGLDGRPTVGVAMFFLLSGWIAAVAVGPLRVPRQETWLPTYAVWFAAGMTLAVIQVALVTSTAPRRWHVVHRLGAAPGACVVLAGACLVIATTPIAGP